MSTKGPSVGSSENSQKRHLLFGTVSFTVCFDAWGLISAFAPSFRQHSTSRLHKRRSLSPCQFFSVLSLGFRSACLQIVSGVALYSLG